MDRAFPQKLSFRIDYLDPQIIGLHCSLGPPESTTQTAYRWVQPFLQGSRQHPYILQWAAPSLKIALTMEILTQYTTWFLEPSRAHSPNGIFNGPAVFCRQRYQKSCYNNSVQFLWARHATWKSSSCRSVLAMYVYNSREFFKNLNVKYWILVHFHGIYTECINIKWTNCWFMHEKVGVKTHCLTPHSKKWGSSDPLDPVLPHSMHFTHCS